MLVYLYYASFSCYNERVCEGNDMILDYTIKQFNDINVLSEADKLLLPHVNCCERILLSSDVMLNLSLSEDVLIMAKGFGGGMKIESVCGAITGSVMVLSHYFRNHTQLSDIIVDYFDLFNKNHEVINCNDLKEQYYDETYGCQNVMLKAAKVLDDIIFQYTQSEVLNEQ